MVVRQRLIGLSIWLGIAVIAASIGQFAFGVNFWVVAAFTLVGIIANALIIQWEDNQPGGWSK